MGEAESVLLRDILMWWTRQMRALVPQRLLSDGNSADALIIVCDDSRDVSQARFILRKKRREVALGRFRLDETGQRAAKAAIRQRPRHVILRPGFAAVLERKVVLPIAAERDITQVLRYEMDRLTPFAAEQVFWSVDHVRRDRTAGRLELSLSLVPKAALQRVLTGLIRIGLSPGSIEAANQFGAVRRIDVLAPRSSSRRFSIVAACSVAALALIAIIVPFVMQAVARSTIENRIAALQPQIAEAESLRHRIASGSAGDDVIAAERARVGETLRVLATVTDLLPDDTVLADLSLRQGKLSISGRSLAAARLIPAMAADPTVHNPSFAAPVTRTADGSADTFVVRAELSP